MALTTSSSCTAKKESAPSYAPITQAFFEPYYPEDRMIIKPGDKLDIKFYFHPELNEQVVIRPDGKISLAFHQGIMTRGLSPEALQARLTRLYSSVFIDPVISVQVERRVPYTVFITGEVLDSGIKPLETDKTIGQLIIQSRVNLDRAALDSTLLIRRASDKAYKVYKIDAGTVNGKQRDIFLLPGDIVYVPKNNISALGDFVKHYIRDIIPPQMSVGIGFNYDLNPD